MMKEKSCGAIVYREGAQGYLFLLEKMTHGHISLPKGHVEENETEEETALREIKEETNLDVELKAGFRRVVSYSPYEGCMKDVVFFLAKAEKYQEMMPQECEVSELVWRNFEEAKELLTFPLDKQTLEAAYNYLKTPL